MGVCRKVKIERTKPGCFFLPFTYGRHPLHRRRLVERNEKRIERGVSDNETRGGRETERERCTCTRVCRMKTATGRQRKRTRLAHSQGPGKAKIMQRQEIENVVLFSLSKYLTKADTIYCPDMCDLYELCQLDGCLTTFA